VIVGGRVIGIFGLGYGKFSVRSTEWRLGGQVLRRVGSYRRDAPEAQSDASVQMGTLWFANTFLVSVRTFGRRNWGGEGVHCEDIGRGGAILSSLGSGGVLSACAMREGDEQNAVDPVSRDGCGHGAP
jgi:hypothetical protein